METNCIFCRIANHEIPADVVYENDEVIAFLDINPVTKGHIIVIPKAHYPWMQETPDHLVQATFVATKNIMTALKQELNAGYVQLGVVGTEIPHFHVHVIPQEFSDELPPVFRKHTAYTDSAEKELYLDRIKKALA